MIKTIGAILLIGGATVIGFSASAALSVRSRSLALILQALNVMRAEIGERLSPLEDVMLRLSKICASPLGEFFAECADEMKEKPDIPFGMIWARELSRADNLRLDMKEKEELCALGNVLGRYSAKEQCISIDHAIRSISSFAKVAEEEHAKLGKLYAKLGIICGISVVIVFI